MYSRKEWLYIEDFILEMAESSRKIKTDSASDEGKFQFKVEAKTSCMDEKILMCLTEIAAME